MRPYNLPNRQPDRPGPGPGGLAGRLDQGVLPQRFQAAGFQMNQRGRITAPDIRGPQNADWNNMYQRLFNASGGNIFGGGGRGGPYNPTTLYATPQGYVDMRTGMGNPPNVGMPESSRYILSPEQLDVIRQRAGYNPETARPLSQPVGPVIPFTPPVQPGVRPTPGQTPPPVMYGPGGRNPGDIGGTSGVPWYGPGGRGPAGMPEGIGGTSWTPWTTGGGRGGGSPWTGGGRGGFSSLMDLRSGPKGMRLQVGQPMAAPPAFPGLTPLPANAPTDFLPMTPQFEATRRGAEDRYAGALADINAARGLVSPQMDLATARLGTDEQYALQRLAEDVANRGIAGSGAAGYLRGRDIGVPFGRAYQDLALQGAQQLGGLSTAEGAAGLDYNQAMLEDFLSRAAQVAAEQPLSVPQYNRPAKAPRSSRSRSRSRNRNRNRNRGR